MTISLSRKTLLQFIILMVPLAVFFLSELVIGHYQNASINKVEFNFTLPFDESFAESHNISVNPRIERVYVTGFFADWVQDDSNFELQAVKSGHWQLELSLPPGDAQYKYVVFLQGDPQGKWLPDPHNTERTSDSHGGHNSVLKRPDYPFYQLIVDIISLGVFVFLAALFILQRLMVWLVNNSHSLVSTFIIGTMLVVLISNISLAFYQVFESRKLIHQGILDAVHQSHLYLKSQKIQFDNLPLEDQAVQDQMRALFWQAQTRVESSHGSVTQITLSDIAIYDPQFNLIHVQSRFQNHSLQLTRAREAGFNTLQNYFNHGVFSPLLEAARQERNIFSYITANPSQTIIDIETTETSLARSLLGFSNMLVPIIEDNKVKGYYAAAIQVKLYGKEILRIILINGLLVIVTLLFAYLLLRSVGQIASSDLKKLTRWTQKINQGDMSSEALITTGAEIKLLADNLGEMQRSLKTSFDKIAQQNLQLNKAAYTDLDTQLPNLKKLTLDTSDLYDTSMIILELDKLQPLQTFLGDANTRELIKGVCERITETLGDPSDFQLYRIAPNRFCLLGHQKEHIRTESLAGALVNAINSRPVSIDNMTLNVSATAGICCVLTQDETIHDQLERAGLALSEAKHQGVAYGLYRQIMDKGELLKHNINMIKRVRTAIQKDKVIPFYQPIVSTVKREVVTLECLVRIKESDNLILPPSAFLENTKQVGLYQSISQIMFKKCIQTLRHSEHRISLNISAQDIENPQSREFIINLMDNNKDVTERVTLELTETEHIENYELMKQFIDKMKTFGVRIALDDFGAGYSNFTHLLSLNIDFIKIDGSLIKNLDRDENAYKITKALVECARSLEIKMVAEFVHNDAIYQLVKELGIEYCQGYLFGAPSEYLK